MTKPETSAPSPEDLEGRARAVAERSLRAAFYGERPALLFVPPGDLVRPMDFYETVDAAEHDRTAFVPMLTTILVDFARAEAERTQPAPPPPGTQTIPVLDLYALVDATLVAAYPAAGRLNCGADHHGDARNALADALQPYLDRVRACALADAQRDHEAALAKAREEGARALALSLIGCLGGDEVMVHHNGGTSEDFAREVTALAADAETMAHRRGLREALAIISPAADLKPLLEAPEDVLTEAVKAQVAARVSEAKAEGRREVVEQIEAFHQDKVALRERAEQIEDDARGVFAQAQDAAEDARAAEGSVSALLGHLEAKFGEG